MPHHTTTPITGSAGVTMKGYHIRYKYKGGEPTSSYAYQRFYRALYGYTQVVTKSNGRTYVYYRKGVLTPYPYIKLGKNTVIIPGNALQPLIEFFKFGKNPAHQFEDLSNWLVTYYVEETLVDESTALKAIYQSLGRILLQTSTGYKSLRDVVLEDHPGIDELLSLRSEAYGIVESPWFSELKNKDPLLKRLEELFTRSVSLS